MAEPVSERDFTNIEDRYVPVAAVHLEIQYSPDGSELVVQVYVNDNWIEILRTPTDHQGLIAETVFLRAFLYKKPPLFLRMLKLLASFGQPDSDFPSDDCPACGAVYGTSHAGACLCIEAAREKERLGLK